MNAGKQYSHVKLIDHMRHSSATMTSLHVTKESRGGRASSRDELCLLCKNCSLGSVPADVA